MSPVTARRGARTYRYYVSQAAIRRDRGEAGSVRRIPAHAIEGLIEAELVTRVRGGEASIQRAVVSDAAVELTLAAPTPGEESASRHDIVRIAAKLKPRGGSKQLFGNDGQPLMRCEPDAALLRAIARGKRWEAQLASGERIGADDIASAEGLQSRYVDKILTLAWLAPNVVERVAAGGRLRNESLTELIERRLPLSWHEQRKLMALI